MGKKILEISFALGVYIPREELKRKQLEKMTVGGRRQEVGCNEQRVSVLQDEHMFQASVAQQLECAEHYCPCTEG